MKISRYALAAVVAVAVTGTTQSAQAAYSCSNATYGSSYSTCSTDNTSNANATTVTSVAVLSAAATQTAGIISNRVAQAIGGTDGSFHVAANGFSASTGKAAGDGSDDVGVWVSGSWTGAEDDNDDTAFDGTTRTGMAGIDYRVSDMTLIGLSAGYEKSDFDTAYNGFGGVDGSLEGSGWTVAPYAAFDMGSMTTTLSVGYSMIDYDTVRYDPNTGNTITGSTDANRYFVNAGVGGSHDLAEHVRLRTNASVFYVSENKDDFTEDESNGSTIAQDGETTHLGRAALDFRLGYMFEGIEPYALAGVEYDFSKSDVPLAAGQTESGTEDDFGAKFGGGVVLNLGDNVTGGLEAYTSQFRSDYDEVTGTATLRVRF